MNIPETRTQYVHACGVTLEVPGEWQAIPRGEGHHEDGMPESGFTIMAPNLRGYRTTLTLTPASVEQPAGESLDLLAKEMVRIIREHYVGAEILSQTEIELQEMPGWAMRYRFEEYEQALLLLLRDESAGLVIRMDLQTTTSLVEDHRPVMLAVVNSLETVHPADLYAPPEVREWSVAAAGISFHAPLDFEEIAGAVDRDGEDGDGEDSDGADKDGDGGVTDSSALVLCEDDRELPLVVTVTGKHVAGDPEQAIERYIDAWCALSREETTEDHRTAATTGADATTGAATDDTTTTETDATTGAATTDATEAAATTDTAATNATTTTVDDCPARTATVRRRDATEDRELESRTLAIADEGLLAVITVTGESCREREIRQVMDTVTATARVVAGEVIFPAVNRGISLRYPREWTAELLAENQVRLFSPPSREHNDYRATISCTGVESAGYGLDYFEEFVAYCGASLVHDGDDIHIVREERRTLPSMEWCHIRWYHRYSAEADLSFSQFQAVISAGTDGMLLVNGATLRELEELRMPVLEEILDSLRIVTPG